MAGHASIESTRDYVDITPTRLAGSLEKAGYFERNRRMVSVLFNQDAIAEGDGSHGDSLALLRFGARPV